MPTSTVAAVPATRTDVDRDGSRCDEPASDDGSPQAEAFAARTSVSYQPILDVARGVAAGFQALGGRPASSVDEQARITAGVVRTALDDFPTLPKNTFTSIPLDVRVASSEPVRAALAGRGGEHGVADLAGIVLEIVGFSASSSYPDLDDALAGYRSRGALISLGGDGAAQPELTGILRLKPAIIRLGRDWIRGIDRSEAKRSAIEITGQLAGQLDAWVLAEGVSTSAELRALAGLGVPLAQGPFVGEPQPHWPEIEMTARAALPAAAPTSDGVLRGLLQRAYTTTNATAAIAVLPETSGFDLLVVVDEFQRPTGLLELDDDGGWGSYPALAVNINTGLADAVARAMARPRPTRFTPLVCTDNAGRVLGVLRIERMMAHLTEPAAPPVSA